MNKFLSVILALLSSNILNAALLDEQTTKLAICSGIIKANSYIDYASDNMTREEMLEQLKVANSLYVENILEKKLTSIEALQYDSLSATNMDMMTNNANNGNFKTEEFEQVISCYKLYSALLLKKSTLDTKTINIINKVSSDNLHNIDVVLGKKITVDTLDYTKVTAMYVGVDYGDMPYIIFNVDGKELSLVGELKTKLTKGETYNVTYKVTKEFNSNAGEEIEYKELINVTQEVSLR